MNFENELDFEDMDDLTLPDHVEWNNEQTADFTLDALDFTQW